MESVMAGTAFPLWCSHILGVEDTIADGTGLNSFKLLAQILYPQLDRIHHTPILHRQQGDNL